MGVVLDMEADTDEFVGEYIRLIYQKPGSNWGIHLVKRDDEPLPVKVTCETLETFREGMLVVVYGVMVDDPRYGPTFRASSMVTYVPDAESSFEVFSAWLRSGVIRQVGPVIANAILQHFGESTRDMLSRPERLKEVSGIGDITAEAIAEDWNRKSSDYRLAGMLHGIGLRGAEIRQVVRYYKELAATTANMDVEVFGRRILENPYRLTDVPGIGFHRADAIAERLGIAEESPLRMEAALVYSIHKLCEERGHTLLAEDWILDYANGAQVLNGDYEALLVPLLKDMETSASPSVIPMAPGYLAPRKYFEAEKSVWSMVLAGQEGVGPVSPELMDRVLGGPLFRYLSEEQKTAIHTLIRGQFGVLTGGPGTGKTTCIKAVCQALELSGRKVHLLAPSGKAAARIREATGYEASTIHLLLYKMMSQGKGRFDNKDVIIVDEASMVDSLLLSWLITHLDSGNALFLVGDVNQLPSVGPGRVFGDILESGMLPVGRLTQNFRSGGIEGIPHLAGFVRDAHLPSPSEEVVLRQTGADLIWFEPQESVDEWLFELAERIRGWLEYGDSTLNGQTIQARDIQVLTPTRKGPLGVYALNRVLRNLLVPESEDVTLGKDDFGPLSWRKGDRVIQLQNDYEGVEPLFNGDLGEVVEVTRDSVIVSFYKFEDGHTVIYDAGNIDLLQHAFALTIHKSQGSEFRYTLMVLAPGHRFMATNPLVYTGITRCQRQLAVLSTKRVFDHAIRREDDVRETCLYRFYAGF
ncbi:AAA family ATPase [Acidithiobacillus sp. M4-SHS-6]|uniref:SF1B family DNA helicase RecD2 n=1 Tax=Acidithiobacillus sp. M4-SHS-6 TaxID=3383024 RepID=UPI0039BDB442